MATAGVALMSPATPEKPQKPAIFSRQDTWTPPQSEEEDDSEEKVIVQHEEEQQEVEKEVQSPRVEEDKKVKEDTKEEGEDVKPAPPNLITSTPRNGPMTLSKSSSLETKNAAAVPALAAGKKKPVPQKAKKPQDGFWTWVLCCLNKDLKATVQTDAETTTTWTLDRDGPKRPIRNLLPDRTPEDGEKKCLVLDLDETLVHSSFKATPNPDYIIPVEIDGHVYSVFVQKRPGVDAFLQEMAKIYELVVYTASLSKYADPLLDLLDTHKTIRYRLFRESCTQYRGSYVKDMSMINRPLDQSIIVDNSSLSFQFHPENAIHCTSFFDDLQDRELDVIGAFLAKIKDVSDVRDHLGSWHQFLNQWEENTT